MLDKEKLKNRLNEIRSDHMNIYKQARNVVESLSAKAVAGTITELLVEINSGDFSKDLPQATESSEIA